MHHRIHVFGIPHVPTVYAHNACAYTQKILKLCLMLKRYYPKNHIMFYGSEENDVVADEHITLVNRQDFIATYGEHDYKTKFYSFAADDHINTKFNKYGAVELKKRLEYDDLVLIMWGCGHLPIHDAAVSLKKGFVVEPGIGYHGSFTKYRVFESYSIMHDTYGKANVVVPDLNHAVIPNYFDINDFDYTEKKGDYFLFLGRICDHKRVHVAIDLAVKLNFRLIVAGQGDFEP